MEAQDHRKSETVLNWDLKRSVALLMAADRAVCTALVTTMGVAVSPPLLSRDGSWDGHRTGHRPWGDGATVTFLQRASPGLGGIRQSTAPGVAVPPPFYSREGCFGACHRPRGGDASPVMAG